MVLPPAARKRRVEGDGMPEEGISTRRLLGLVKARLPDAELGKVIDGRDARGRVWCLEALLATLVVGLASGRKSLKQVELLTKKFRAGMQRCLGVFRRVPDTTMRDALTDGVSPDSLRTGIHAQVKAAHRRKSLKPEVLPVGVVHLDGKTTALPSWDDHYAEKRTYKDWEKKRGAYGALRTISCCLISSMAKVCLDAIPLLAGQNEVGFYREALTQVLAVYGRSLFQIVCYDAGGCSEENADFTVLKKLDYVFAIKGNQPGILDVMKRLLGSKVPWQAAAETRDVLSNKNVVTRRVFLCEKEPLFRWKHARTFLRVDSEIRTREGNLVQQKTSEGEWVDVYTRYFLSSKEMRALTPAQWLLLVRRMWSIENNLHHTLDVALKEDDFPFIPSSPTGSLNVLLLRRIAYNLMALFRAVTQHPDGKGATPWAELMFDFLFAAGATLEEFTGLRTRVAASS
jgi:hypothetical protein